MQHIQLPKEIIKKTADFNESFSVCPWEHFVEPFHMVGNIYYIGDDFAGALLIDTGEGLIIVDTGMPTCAPFLVHNIWKLGFDPANIKILLHTHGHFDHLGATMTLKRLSNALIYLSGQDAEMISQRPDLMFMGHLEMGWPIIQVDREIEDGDVISLGNTKIECLLTPGHTDGTMSFIFHMKCDEEEHCAALFGGVGLITLKRDYLLDNFGTLENREKYLKSLDKLEKLKGIEIVLSNHPDMNQTFEKQKLKKENSSNINPFVNPGEWKSFIQELRKKYDRMIKEESIKV